MWVIGLVPLPWYLEQREAGCGKVLLSVLSVNLFTEDVPIPRHNMTGQRLFSLLLSSCGDSHQKNSVTNFEEASHWNTNRDLSGYVPVSGRGANNRVSCFVLQYQKGNAHCQTTFKLPFKVEPLSDQLQWTIHRSWFKYFHIESKILLSYNCDLNLTFWGFSRPLSSESPDKNVVRISNWTDE